MACNYLYPDYIDSTQSDNLSSLVYNNSGTKQYIFQIIPIFLYTQVKFFRKKKINFQHINTM